MDLFDTTMFFDSRSMIGILFWANLFLAAMIFAFATTTKITKQKEAIARAIVVRVLFAGAFLLQLLRGIAPDYMTINVGVSLLFCCFYTDADIMISFMTLEREKYYKRALRITLIAGLLLFNISSVLHWETISSTLSSIIILAIYGVPTVSFIVKRNSSRFMRTTGAFYVLFLISVVQRIIIPFTEVGRDEYSNAISESGFYLVLVIISVCGVMSTFLFVKERDDKELKAAIQAAQEANNAKSAFLANMSHEIRTPMNAIIGMSELLQTESLNERQSQYVSDIKTSSAALLDIINDILDISKVESGKLELSPVHYDLHGLLSHIESIFSFAAKNKGIEFELKTDKWIPQFVYGDDVRLRQILTNLCGNAVKFTERGQVTLRVFPGDETITFEVEDSGTGIPAGAIAAIFDPFTQVADSKNRSTKGTGLGLSISRHLARMMGGDIEVISDYGHGSIFTLTIPKVLGDESLVIAEKTPVISFRAPQCRVLVVDDNEINLKVALGYMELFGIEAETATSGAQGIEMVKAADYDIVFMDHMMPDMDGVEALKKIRAMKGKYEELKVIALTANAVSGSEQMFLDNGFDGFLSKPIELARLTETLREKLPEEKITGIDEALIMPGAQASTQSDVSADATAKAADELIAKIGEIGGLNTKSGLANFAGNAGSYIETVEMFYKSITPECGKMAAHLEDGNLQAFAVSIHGMKASLATVGISELSSLAADMEVAAKSGGKTYCEAKFPGFAERMTNIHGELAGVFATNGEKGDNGQAGLPAADEAFLAEKMKEAMAAADDLDNDLGIETLSVLLGYNYNPIVERHLKTALDSMKNFEFDDAKAAMQRVSSLTG